MIVATASASFVCLESLPLEYSNLDRSSHRLNKAWSPSVAFSRVGQLLEILLELSTPSSIMQEEDEVQPTRDPERCRRNEM